MFTTIVYGVIDILWNIGPGRIMYEVIHANNGTDLSFQKAFTDIGASEGISFLVFFILIALANVQFVIVPAIKARSVGKAAFSGFLLGCAAYATYIIPIYGMVKTWPLILVPIDIFIGGMLSLVTASIIVAVRLRQLKRSI